MKQSDKKWLGPGLFSLAQRLTQVFFGIASLFLLTRLWDRDTFGTWAFYISITAILEVGRNGLVENATIKAINEHGDEAYPSILRASSVLNALLSILILVLMLPWGPFAAWFWETPILRELFWLYIVTLIGNLFYSQSNFIQQAKLDFKGLFITTLVRQASFFAGVTHYWFSGTKPDLIYLALWFGLTTCLAGGVGYFMCLKYLRFSPKTDWSRVQELLHYGKFVFATNISAMLFTSIDQMQLGKMLNMGALALYNAATRFNNLIDVPITTMAQIMFPHSVRKFSEEGKDGVRNVYERSVGITLGLVLPAVAFVLLVPGWLLWLVAGEQYVEAAPLLQVSICFSLFQPFIRQFGTILDATGHPHQNFYVVVATTLLNALMAWIMINWLGTIGAPLGTLTTLFITFIITFSIMRNRFGVRIAKVLHFSWHFYLDLFHLVKQKLMPSAAS